MFITREDVQKISETMDLFPEAQSFKLEQSNHSGIGNVLTLIVHTKVNGLDGTFNTEISGIENW
jgi:hypothetical protein